VSSDDLSIAENRVSQTVACKWQIFGFRMVFIVVYFPIDFIMMLCVMRYCGDIIFNYNLRDKARQAIIAQNKNPIELK